MQTKRVGALHPYKPGEQLTGQYIKLNANESPFPPADAVIKKVIDFIKENPKKISLYPDSDSNKLRDGIAKILNATGGVLCRTCVTEEECEADDVDKLPFNVTRDMIYAGNGSDEVLSFMFYAFIEGKCVTTSLTYSFYPVYCSYYGVGRLIVPLIDNKVDIDGVVKMAVENDAPIIITNPNAPTGVALTRHDISGMLRRLKDAGYNKSVIIDEAYCDFGGESCIALLRDYSNLIIVRTFSKSFCAAGARIGYIVANEAVIKIMHTVKNCVNHFPLDAITQVLGEAISENLPYYVLCAKKVVKERDSFIEYLTNKGVEVLPSKTNFVLVKFPKISGGDLYDKIKAKGVLIRHFDDETKEWSRITIGDESEMKVLRAIIDEIMAGE